MTSDRQTRMSFMRRPFKAGAAVRQRLPQYPADLIYLEGGRHGDLLLTLQMQSEGDAIEIRLSPSDVARVFKVLVDQMPDESLRAVLRAHLGVS
jgi:hypothetical protein